MIIPGESSKYCVKIVTVIIQLNYISFALLIDKFDVKMSAFRMFENKGCN